MDGTYSPVACARPARTESERSAPPNRPRPRSPAGIICGALGFVARCHHQISGDDDDDPVEIEPVISRVLADRKDGMPQDAATTDVDKGLRPVLAQPNTRPGGRDDDRGGQVRLRLGGGGQDLVENARGLLVVGVLGERARRRTRRARVSMRFSPADRPRSCSRRHGSRTISATLMMSPEISFSWLALKRRAQLVGSSVCGARNTWKTWSRPSSPTTSRTPTYSNFEGGSGRSCHHR